MTANASSGTVDPAEVVAAIAADPELAEQVVAAIADTDNTLAANSDSRLATQKATKGYVTTQTGLLVPKSLVDAKGDLLVGTADNTVARKAVGANGKVLVADSGQSDGLKWGGPSDIGAVATKTYLDVALARSPVGLWAHNETSGTTSTDLSGNGNHGTYTGGYTLNQTGGVNGLKATLLNGSSGYVTVPDANSLDLTTAACLELWVKIDSSGGTGEHGLISKGGSSGYLMEIYGGGVLGRFAGNGPTNVNSYPQDQWGLISMEWNNAYVWSYLNGVLIDKTGAAGPITPGSAALLIGQVGGGNWFKGLIGPAAVYNQCIGPMGHAKSFAAGCGLFA